MKKLKNGINMLGYKKTYTLPFKFVIPNYINEFLEQNDLLLSSGLNTLSDIYIYCLKGNGNR